MPPITRNLGAIVAKSIVCDCSDPKGADLCLSCEGEATARLGSGNVSRLFRGAVGVEYLQVRLAETAHGIAHRRLGHGCCRDGLGV